MLLPKKYRIGIQITLIFVASFVILFYNFRNASPGFLRKMALEIVVSLDSVVNAPFEGLRSAWTRYIFLLGLQEENRRLKEKNARLNEESIRFREGYLESIRLKNIIKLSDNLSLPKITAKVVGRNPSSIFKMILINRGTAHGLRAGLPVIAVSGVVGRILETSWNASRVLLIIDENSNIDALLQENRVQGMLQGASSAGCNLKYVAKTAEVKAGDIVVSSGVDGIFPKGLPLGVVRSASKKDADLFQKVNVAPFVDPAVVEEVIVIMPDRGETK